MRRRKDNNLFWSFVRFSIVPVIIIFVFMLVWLKSEVTSLEYRISEHEKERMDLLEQKKELIVKRSDLLSVKNIEYVAMKKLGLRSEEHTSELQSHRYISYAVFCLKKKKKKRSW